MEDRNMIESALRRISEIEEELRQLRDRLLSELNSAGGNEPADEFEESPGEQDDQDEMEEDPYPDTPFHRLMNTVGKLKDMIREQDVPVFPDLTSFAGKAVQIASGISEDNSTGGQACKIIFDIIGFHDRVCSVYLTDGWYSLRNDIQALLVPFIEFLNTQGYTVLPAEKAIGTEYSDDVHRGETVYIFSEKPENTVLSVNRHGISSEEGTDQTPQYILSRPAGNPLYIMISKSYEVLLSYYFRTGSEKATPDVEKIRSWIRSLPEDSKPEESALIYVRQILNIFSQISRKPKIVKKTIDSILVLLKEHGMHQIPVSIGSEFDSSFSTSKYERKYVESDKPKDTIVSIIQYGLADTSGIPIQKTIVGVSRG